MKRFIFSLILLLGLVGVSQAQYGESYANYKPKRVYFPSIMFSPLDSVAVDGIFTGYGTGNPNHAEVSSFGFGGFQMDSGDYVNLQTLWPYDVDTNYPIAFRVLFTSTSADDDGSIDWRVVLNSNTDNVLMVTGEGAGTRDAIAFAADSIRIQFSFESTVWDTIGTDSLSTGGYGPDKLVTISVELDDRGDASAAEIVFLGLEMAYVPKLTNGEGMRASSVYVSGAPSLKSGSSTKQGIGIALNRKP